MILVGKGKLSSAQAMVTNTTTISENIVDISAADHIGPLNLWAIIETSTIAVGDASDTYEFSVVASSSTSLTVGTSTKEIVGVTITSYADRRLATVGKQILAVNIGNMLADIDTSTYRYIGINNILSDGATISVNAVLSPTAPNFLPVTQTTTSNVTVPAICSAASGLEDA
jgi:hypothetical protein